MTRQASEAVGDTEGGADAQEVWHGLNTRPRRLPCKLFYDDVGSQLFEQICETQEYYPTRTELTILREHVAEMIRDVGPRPTLVEWGSGASIKTRVLLSALSQPQLYVPIDISEQILVQSARGIEREYAGLEVRPVVADYLQPLQLPLTSIERERPIVTFFPGSTLGNFEPDAAIEFLAKVRAAGGRRQHFLLGTDLPKAPEILEAAYDDAGGITARFNLNILHVLNRRFGAKFDVAAFTHRAVFNAEAGRVEMHLVSRERQVMSLFGKRITIDAGEPIVTEHCYKYGLAQLAEMANSAGFRVARSWTDPDQRFAVHLLRPQA